MSPAQKSNLKQEWESWEHLIEDDLKRLEHRIQACYSSMSKFSINEKEREAYVLPRLVGLIEKVTGKEQTA